MKKLALIILAALFSFGMAMAQAPEGSIYLGSSTALWGGYNSLAEITPANNAGISFTKSKYKYEDETVDGPKMTSFNLSPRVGYAFTDGLVVGLKLDVLSFKETDTNDDEFKVTGLGAGPFVKYFIASEGNAKPFVEAEAAIGRLTNKYNDNDENKENTMHLGGGVGVAFFFNDNIAFDVLAGYTYSSTKDPDSESDSKSIASGFGVGVGFTLFLNQQ